MTEVADLSQTRSIVLILAGAHDEVARWLAEYWAPWAVLLTPVSLSSPGWTFAPGTGKSGSLALEAGRTLPVTSIRAVFTRLPSVIEEDLGHIIETDRAYVAAEMTAFLLSWLTELPCPVLNRPTPACLAGPYWRPEQWARVAAGLGMPVRPIRRMVPGREVEPLDPTTIPVTVVGGQWFGPVDAGTGARAVQLAEHAGADILRVFFEAGNGRGLRFAGADLWPDVSDPAVASAILHRLVNP